MNKKILVVEDNQKNMYLLKFILEKAGYEVISAEDGQAGITAAMSDLPDMILMDMQLPVMDGFEATRRLKAEEKTRRIPIVALTAYAMQGDQEKTEEAGCEGYLKKPIDPETFTDTIAELLKKLCD
jgi:CheY-like chemotaxis protein